MRPSPPLRDFEPRSTRGIISFVALCLTGVLTPIACGSELPVQQPPPASAGATTNPTAGGSPNGGGGASSTAGSSQAGTAGAPPNPVTCPDCVEFGLETRPANPTCLAGDPPPTNYRFSRIWKDITLGTALDLVPTPDGNTLIVSQKNGVARAIPKSPTATQAETREFLNLSSVINTDAESGLLSMAFHPDYANNGFVYVVYTRNDGNHSTRVARFKTNNGGQSLDLASETKVYEHTQVRGTHHGGDMKFGADGYLYVSFGDNNTGDDHDDFTAQNRKSLYGAVVRLDVNVPGEGYKIPPDNPGVADTSWAPEVYAKGFRNPWRFSFDRQTQELWLADPGEESNGNQGDDGQANPYEEVDRVVKGKQYGWPMFQGTHCFHDCTMEKGEPPELEFSHNGGPAAVVGGFVYRGIAIPSLVGKYVFGEYESGEIFYYDPQTKMRESLGFAGKVVAFGEDKDGELYALRESGQIEKLEDSGGGTGGFPEKLSQTGCVSAADAKQIASGVIPFSVALPFWSDGAEKERFLALPDGKAMDVAADGDFTLPVGGVTMKNFRHEGKLFETRFFVRHNDGSYYGYSYEWNAEQTDATLVPQNGKDAMVGTLAWTYPSRTACFTCHSEAAGRSLGLETRQLNAVATYPATGKKANQFNTLLHVGMITGNTALREPYPAKDDATAPLDTRARAYLATNCSNCHRPDGPGRGKFNALFDTAFKDMGICNEMPEHGNLGVEGSSVFKPGAHASSVMWLRMSQRMESFMPPIASKIPDQVGADLLASWIDSVTACP
jgi:uncharacterized repeat protein (TIGR03806 family)